MKIAVSGSRGLVGSALLPLLERASHEVHRLVRGIPAGDDIGWDLKTGEIEHEKLAGLDAVVHLAGEGIAEGRWTAAKKARIRDSRVNGTRLVCEGLAKLERKPSVLVCASAIGYYGDRGDEKCDESAPPGVGFLPDVCTAWEDATLPAVHAGIRVVNLRIGVVLSTRGGALSKMLLHFKLGLGGIVGDGKQYWSWISLDDVVQATVHCIDADGIRGPVNGVAPNAVTNREFTKTLGRVLRRPTLFPMPAFAARLALGETADALLLCSAHVVPHVLQESGFQFQHEDLESALMQLLR
ncbi:MAG: TIGR01777 family protein [Planctomycetaceae bacterium]|nr:TIGR01777 family protein [Planctomycetaceae bacterium]